LNPLEAQRILMSTMARQRAIAGCGQPGGTSDPFGDRNPNPPAAGTKEKRIDVDSDSALQNRVLGLSSWSPFAGDLAYRSISWGFSLDKYETIEASAMRNGTRANSPMPSFP
jgi:hypothetical protein